MNVTSRFTNYTTVQYAQSRGIEIAWPRGYLSSSPTEKKKKKKKKKASTTKEWVQKAYYTTSRLPAGKNSASVFPDDDTLPPPPIASATKANDSKIAQGKRKSVDKGEPAVYFEESEVRRGAEKFKFCLIGKFPGKKPSLEKIREWAGKEWKLEGGWSITSLDRHHVFVRLENEADMIRVWPRNRWFIGEHLMKVFKWWPTFQASSSSSLAEPSFAAVWISFPHLPVVFFQEDFLYKIASLVGRVICMDEQTKNVSRTSMARVCVEVDLVKDNAKRIWIGVGKEEGFLQEVYYESLPAYCTNCSQQGHHTKACKSSMVPATANASRWVMDKSISNCKGFNLLVKKDGSQIDCRTKCLTCPVTYKRDENKDLLRRGSFRQSIIYRFASMGSKKKTILRQRTTHGGDGNQNQQHVPAPGLIPGTLKFEQEFPHAGILKEKEDGIQDKELQFLSSKLEMHLGTGREENGKDSFELEEENSPGEVTRKDASAAIEKGKEVATKDAEYTKSYFNEEQSRTREESTHSMESTQIAKKRFLSKNTLLFWRRRPGKIIGRNTTGEVMYNAEANSVAMPHKNGEVLDASTCRQFTFEEIKQATRRLSPFLIVGEGGFGRVYKGIINNGTEVAIKMRAMSSSQGMQEFQTEIDLLSRLRHRHVVTLLGFCREGTQNILVYEYLARGSLKDLLYTRNGNLPWAKRLEICVGAARGLQFLHTNAIIHRDVKPTNILIDDNWDAKVSDFGISKEGPHDDEKSHVTTQVMGTAHYVDPSYVMTGHVTSKSDVYSFGVVLLEVLFGRAPIDRSLSQVASNLVSWAKSCKKKGNLEKHIDPQLTGQISAKSLQKFIKIALLCVELDASFRPEMKAVLKVLQQLLDRQEKHDATRN